MTWISNLVRCSVRQHVPLVEYDETQDIYGNKRDMPTDLDLHYATRKWFVHYEDLPGQIFASAINRQSSGCHGLRSLSRDIAEVHGVSTSEIVFQHNADDLLRNLLFCLIEENDEVVFSAPCPVKYRNLVRILGGKDITVPNGSDLTPIPDLISSACNSRTKAIYLKNPLYFSGLAVRHRDIVELLSMIEKNRIILIIDECEDVSTVASNILIGTLLFKDFRNVVPIRSFYDYFNIGCGDLAYAIMPADLAKEYQKVSRTSFVPPILIREASIIINNPGCIEDLKKIIRIEKEKVNHSLAAMELHPLRNCTSGISIPIRNCDQVWERLLKERIILTNGNNMGIQDHLILSLGLPDENERFLSVLGKVMRTIGN